MDIFIDRNEDRKAFLSLINNYNHYSRVVILSATTGIGKTSLIDKVINEYGYTNRYRVEISNGEAFNSAEGIYFIRFLRLFSEYAEKDLGKNTFDQYIHDLDIPNSIIRGGINQFIPVLGHEMRHYETVQHNVTTWFEQNDYYYESALNYIRRILSSLDGQQVIFSIENAQGLDPFSTKLITNLLKTTNNILLFLEYTITNSTYIPEKLVDSFNRADIVTKYYKLNRVPKEEIMKVISINRLYDIVGDTYDKSDGNLFKLRLLRNEDISTSNDIQYEDAIRSIMARLNDDERIVLSSVELHQGYLSDIIVNKLHLILPDISEQNVSTVVHYLLKNNIVSYRNGYYVLAHDSISNEIKTDVRFNKATVFAINAWIKYYQQQNKAFEITNEVRLGNSRQIILMALRARDYDTFAEELESISKALINYPISLLVNYLDSILKIYHDNKEDNSWDKVIIQKCLFIYYQCGQFKKIIKLEEFSDIKSLDDISKICFLAAVSSEDAFRAEKIMRSILTIPSTSDYKTAKQLLKIRILRAKGEQDRCKKTWDDLIKQVAKEGSSLIADVYRYVTLCEMNDYTMRIANLKQAYNLYTQSKRSYGIIATCLALARDSFFIKNHDDSRAWLETAKNQLPSTLYPRYQYYNNAGLLYMFDKDYGTALDSYNRALEICTNSDDLTLIRINSLCVYLLLKQYTEVSDAIFDSLYEGCFATDSILYDELVYNCYQYADKRNLTDKKEQLAPKYKSVSNRIHNSESANHYQERLLDQTNKVCLPVFIVDWDIDYYSVLGN